MSHSRESVDGRTRIRDCPNEARDNEGLKPGDWRCDYSEHRHRLGRQTGYIKRLCSGRRVVEASDTYSGVQP